ncbi:hypothetical protein [Chromobacterium phragmitis]|uniref:hypothetical protein n=1 Tax=Chromobacterium phragmitis TaxID=2202141 RepID=UPI0018E0AAC6|nr:hypothetical protein [Chromobacterium phragmitis]
MSPALICASSRLARCLSPACRWQQHLSLAVLIAVFLRADEQFALVALIRLLLSSAGALLLTFAFLLLLPFQLLAGMALRLQ